ncbi:MAG TPA: hypothetical protein DCY00_06990, partial [Actinobacteria bacterium]|nr:hypothetical protein [Actinomycetota bacterium]
YRDFSRTDWKPFIKAAVERNPVSIDGCKNLSDDEVIEFIKKMPEESIYDGSRVAQPDEVWNYHRGDGLEKAIFILNVFRKRNNCKNIIINLEKNTVSLTMDKSILTFSSGKNLTGTITLDNDFA